MKELEQLENQIEMSLKHIRSRKVENLTAWFIYFYNTLFSVAFNKGLICLQSQMLLDQLFDLKSKVIMMSSD